MRVTTKGQVTIPVEIRRRLGLGPNSEVEFEMSCLEVEKKRHDAVIKHWHEKFEGVKKQLESTTLKAAGKTFSCARRVTTLKSKTGKRVITEWNTTQAPRLRVRRVEKRFDAKGKQIETITMDLAELAKHIGDLR